MDIQPRQDFEFQKVLKLKEENNYKRKMTERGRGNDNHQMEEIKNKNIWQQVGNKGRKCVSKVSNMKKHIINIIVKNTDEKENDGHKDSK